MMSESFHFLNLVACEVQRQNFIENFDAGVLLGSHGNVLLCEIELWPCFILTHPVIVFKTFCQLSPPGFWYMTDFLRKSGLRLSGPPCLTLRMIVWMFPSGTPWLQKWLARSIVDMSGSKSITRPTPTRLVSSSDYRCGRTMIRIYRESDFSYVKFCAEHNESIRGEEFLNLMLQKYQFAPVRISSCNPLSKLRRSLPKS